MIHLDIQAKSYKTARNNESPIFTGRIEFDCKTGELHIHVDFKRAAGFGAALSRSRSWALGTAR
jgi:hypothetical protein